MPRELPFDPRSDETRELLAEIAYESAIDDRAACRREHDLSDEDLYFTAWSGMDDDEKHPYRVAVAVCMDAVIQVYEL